MSNKITIDGRNYDLNKLSNDAKAQLISLQFADAEIQRLQAQLAAFQTARNAYANALNQLLPTVPDSDTISFN